jgi:hypothetical protein
MKLLFAENLAPSLARAIGRCAQAYILEQHAAERVASMYWDVLSRLA